MASNFLFTLNALDQLVSDLHVAPPSAFLKEGLTENTEPRVVR